MIDRFLHKYEFTVWGVLAGITIIIGPYFSGILNFLNEFCIAISTFLKNLALAIPLTLLNYAGMLKDGSWTLSVMQWMSDILDIGLSHLSYTLLIFFVIDSAYRFFKKSVPPVKLTAAQFIRGSFAILVLWVVLLIYSGFLA